MRSLRTTNQPLRHSPGKGASPVMASSPPGAAASQRRRINHWGNPSPVIELSPKTLLATNRIFCEVCNRGFQREQNLHLHRRGHNLPWKLKKKTNGEVKKKVYICPELGCVHHDPSRALGDLTGIKKLFSPKHGGEKKFSCEKCNKKYGVHSDWKAHNKICGTKEYICQCGTTFSRWHDSFTYHLSFCDAFIEVAWHTTNRPPHPTTAWQLAWAPLLVHWSQGAISNSQLRCLDKAPQVLIHLLVCYQDNLGSAIQPKLSFPGNTAPSNMFNLSFSGSADVNSPHNDLDLNITNSFCCSMINAETSPHKILNSTLPSPQLSATALLQKDSLLTGENSKNAAIIMKSTGSSLSGGMKFNSYGGALGVMSSGGGTAGGSTLQQYGSHGSAGKYGGGTEYLSDKMNAPYGGMMYKVNNADGMLVGEVNNNVFLEPEMNNQSEYRDKLTRDFLGMGNGMNSKSGGGVGTNLSDS